MYKFLAIIFVLSGMAFCDWENSTGPYDTTIVSNFRSDSLKYSKVMSISAYQNAVIVVSADDTSAAGFASDSINFAIKYRLGLRTWGKLSNSGKLYPDTAWSKEWALDTFNIKGTNKIYQAAADQTIDQTTDQPLSTYGLIDTLNVSKFATLIRTPIIPAWAELIQIEVKGLAGNKIGSYIRLIIQKTQRILLNSAK